MATIDWTGVAGDWDTTNNWTGNVVPGPGDVAVIGSGSATLTSGDAAIDVAGVTIGSGAKVSIADPGVTQSISGNFVDGGHLYIDAGGGDGGSSLTIAGTLSNSGALYVGSGGLGAATTLTVGGLVNTGGIAMTGGGGNLALLDDTGAAPTSWTGKAALSGNALLEFASGGIATIASGAEIQLTGTSAHVALAGNTGSDSALVGLSSNAGKFSISDGVILSLNAGVNLGNSGHLYIDAGGGDGGSSLTIAGTLSNSGALYVGSGGLGAATTLTVGGLVNTGGIAMTGGGGNLALLDDTGAAPTSWTGKAALSGNALLEFASGGIATIASGAEIQLTGTSAHVALAGNTGSDSALVGLSSNAGKFSISDGVILSLNAGVNLGNSGHLYIDAGGGDGGSSLTIAGTLSNSGALYVGSGGLGAATTLTVGGLVNTGGIELNGGSGAGDTATVTVNGAAVTSGKLVIGSASALDVTGGNDFTQTGGTTTVAGTLTAAAADISGGVLDFTGAPASNIAISLGGSGTVEFDGAVDAGETVTFGAGGDLFLADPAGFAGHVAGFEAGDTIDVKGIGLAASYAYSGGVLTLLDGSGGTLAQLHLTTPITNPKFTLTADTQGGTDVSVSGQSGTIYSGTITTGIVLKTPATQQPATVAAGGDITNTTAAYNGDAVYGTNAAAWNFTNLGTIKGTTSAASSGVELTNGGTVFNGQYGSSGAFIQGSSYGVEILGAAGTVFNFGTILGGSANGVYLTEGGIVTNYGLIRSYAVANNAGLAIWHARGTVVNFGTIENLVSYVGVHLDDGGYVTNASAGLVDGAAGGIKIDTSTGTVVNTGTVIVGGTHGTGVALFNGGSVSNGEDAATGALIEGNGGLGVYIGHAAGTVTNDGTILSNAAGGFSYFAVFLAAGGSVYNGTAGSIAGDAGGIAIGGAAGTVVNHGQIAATGTGYIDGIYLAVGGSVANYGTIAATGGTNGIGVDLAQGGTVTNGKKGSKAGLIVGSAVGVELTGNASVDLSNFGTIKGGADGVLSKDAATTIVNSGKIEASAGYGVYLYAGGALTNAKGGLIEGKSDGVIVTHAGADIVNRGTIEGTGKSGVGVDLVAAGSTVTNAGKIIGKGGAAVVMAGADEVVVIDKGATFTGAVADFQQGDTLDFAGVVATGYRYANGVLTLLNGAKTLAQLSLSTPVANPSFTLAADGKGGTEVTVGAGSGHGTIYSGTFLDGIVLKYPATQIPATIAAGSYVTNQSGGLDGDAVYGETAAAWTLTNLAKIAGYGAAGIGVLLNAGGSVVNGAAGGSTASIAGYVGIEINAAAGTIANYGTIESSSTYGIGILLSDGGNVANGSGGLIQGTRVGIEIDNGAGSIANSGSILGGGGALFAVHLSDGGSIGNGAGGALIRGADGIEIDGAAGTVTNYGTILGTGSAGYAVLLTDGGSVTNGAGGRIDGSKGGVEIDNGNATLANYGLIESKGAGVILGSSGTILNSGTIESLGSYAGAHLVNGGYVLNKGLLAGISDGIYIGGNLGNRYPGAAGTIVNAGIIRGKTGAGARLIEGGSIANQGLIEGAAAGVEIGDTAKNAGTVGNFGTIDGTGANGIGVAFASAGGTLTNGGTIIGNGGTAVAFRGGGNLLIEDPGAVFAGIVNGGGGSDDRLELAAGAATGTLSRLGSSYIGFDAVVVDAGAVWQISGAAAAVAPAAGGGAPDLTNDGTLIAGGSLRFGAVGEDTGDSGTIQVGGGATVEFAAAVAAGQTILFTDATGLVALDAASGFAAAFAGFQKGDVIDLAGITATGLSFSGGVLTLTDDGATVAALGFSGSYAAADFGLAADGRGGTEITYGAAKATQLFSFVFTYADGSEYYTGTVADNGSYGYAAIAASNDPVIVIKNSAGQEVGYYTIYADGTTAEASGAVSVNRFFPFTNYPGGYIPLLTSQGRFDGGAGLGSEADSFTINGVAYFFSDILEPRPTPPLA